MSFVRSWSSTQCGNQPQGKVLWRSWLCNVHSAGKNNTWLKRQSSWPFLRDQQRFQTEFDLYASPNRCYTRKICVLLWGWMPLKGLLHLSMIKPYLINSSINIPYSPPHYQKNHGSIFIAALKDTNFAPRMWTTMANKPLRQVGAGDIASFLHIWWDPEFASTWMQKQSIYPSPWRKMGQYVSACFSLFAGWFWWRQNLILKHQKVTWSLLDKILCL